MRADEIADARRLADQEPHILVDRALVGGHLADDVAGIQLPLARALLPALDLTHGLGGNHDARQGLLGSGRLDAAIQGPSDLLLAPALHSNDVPLLRHGSRPEEQEEDLVQNVVVEKQQAHHDDHRHHDDDG